MKKLHFFLLPLAAIFFIFSKCKEDPDISSDVLPAAIKSYLDQNFPGYELEEMENETLCTGLAVTEVEIEVGDDTETELTFDGEGTMIFTSTEIKVSDLPAAVSSAVAAKYPGATIEEAERDDLAGGGVRYEVEVKTGGIVREALFEADGTFICDAEETDEE